MAQHFLKAKNTKMFLSTQFCQPTSACSPSVSKTFLVGLNLENSPTYRTHQIVTNPANLLRIFSDMISRTYYVWRLSQFALLWKLGMNFNASTSKQSYGCLNSFFSIFCLRFY